VVNPSGVTKNKTKAKKLMHQLLKIVEIIPALWMKVSFIMIRTKFLWDGPRVHTGPGEAG